MKTKLIIVDISNFIFRAFYAIRPLTSPDGTPVNAVNGVLSMMMKMIASQQPTHLLIARDIKGDTFRNELYDQYKANRSEPPEDLVPQFGLIEKLIEKMQMKSVAVTNYEADDVIGSAVTRYKNKVDEILIASGDKDLMQFVGDNVFVLDTMKGVTYDAQGVKEKMGVDPNQMVDYLSIVGDSSDNIPGMKGIGAKGAAKLLAEHGTLDRCIEVKDSFTAKKLVNAFENHLDDALLSKKLINIECGLEMGFEFDELKYCFSANDELREFLAGLGFKSALRKIDDMAYNEQRADEEPQQFVNISSQVFENKEIEYEEALSLLESAKGVSVIASYDEQYKKSSGMLTFSFDGKKSFTLQLPKEQFDSLLSILWSDSTRIIMGHDLKKDLRYLENNDIEYKSDYFDVMQAHYAIDVSTRHDLTTIAERYLGYQLTELGDYGSQACLVFQLTEIFRQEIERLNLEGVVFDMDHKVIPILGKMENNGVAINPGFFTKLENEFGKKILELQEKIGSYYDGDINLRSPKQVGELLFDRLELPVIKKTKTGFSTDVEVLAELDARELSPVPGLILKFREIEKLQSTYVKAIPQLRDIDTDRVHTHFQQSVTTTGRLSSVNPNLQNIPIRSELGRQIRKGFIASAGNLFLSADYSQIELRLLAHFSKDATMVKSFKNDEDIHAQTAAEVLGISLDEVKGSDRSMAKAINFGLMYGQSSFGLAKSLGISRREAKEYIITYFERFSSVKVYIDILKEFCEEHGYSKTLHGRKRFIPEIHSKNRNTKSMAERLAVNSPIQGTAADLIKVAMINIDKRMKEERLISKMLLQVHDELIFEIPENELQAMEILVREEMEGVATLSVPLKVDMGMGVNWFDLK